MNFKVIVAHPGKQHSYQLASALEMGGILHSYITTVYDDQKSMALKLVKMIVGEKNRKRANSRKTSLFPNEKVKTFCEWRGLLLLAILRLDKTDRRLFYNAYNNYVSRRFGVHVAKYAIKNKVDAVVCYDTNACYCFDYLKQNAPNIIRIQDVAAINRIYMKSVYQEDMKRAPEYSNYLQSERGFVFKQKNINLWQKEIDGTDFFIAPSKIVQKSLEYSGVDDDKIFICPYGTNFTPIETKINFFQGDKLNVVYIGNATQMKGIFYLLDAFMELPDDKFSLTIVGMYDEKKEIFERYKSKIKFVGYVQHEEVKRYLEISDIFVFPSLGDSFGLVVLEAMAYGLPVICSDHAGAADAIIEGENGFVIPIGSTEEIKNKLWYCYENKDFVRIASKVSLECLGEYTWDNYQKKINGIFDEIRCWTKNIDSDNGDSYE